MTTGRSGLLRASCLASILIIGVSAGCDRRATGREGEEIPIPQVDLSTLPDGVRELALEARDRALRSPSDPEAVGELGVHYYAHDFWSAAAACLERAAVLDPDSFKWRYYAALAYAARDDVGRGIEWMEKAVALDGTYAAALVELADMTIERDPARSAELYRRALQLDPEDAAAHFGLGECARLEGRREEALDQFRRAIALFPDYAAAHYALAMLLSADGRREEAEEHIRRRAGGFEPPLDNDPLRLALEQRGESSKEMQRLARHLAEGGNLEEAERLLRRAVGTDVSGVNARRSLGIVLGMQERFEEAAEQFRMALAANPDSIETKSYLGQTLSRLGRDDQALALFGEVLNRHPEHAPTLIGLGKILYRMGRTQEALEGLRRGVEIMPANGEYRYTLANRLIRVGEHDEAIEHLRKAVHLMPRHAGARYTLGQLLEDRGDREGARAEFEEAVRISPRFAAAHAVLARIALEEGDAGAAVRSAQRACELGRYSNPEHLEMLAAAYAEAGRPDDAERMRRKAAARR